MKKNIIILIFESLVIGALIFFIFFQRDDNLTLPLADFVIPPKIRELTIQNGEELLTFINKSPNDAATAAREILTRQDLESWEVKGGGQIILNNFNLLLSALKNISLSTYKLTPMKNLSELGLSPAKVTINIKSQANSVQILIGSKNDYFEQFYLKLSNIPDIYLASDSLVNIAMAPRSAFVIDPSSMHESNKYNNSTELE